MADTNPRERNPLAKAFATLAYMASMKEQSATLGEIAAGINQKPSTIHRVLAMLEDEQLIQQDSNRGRYALGLKFMQLVQSAAAKSSPKEMVRPYLTKLRNQTEETAWFATYRSSDHTIVFIESLESMHPVRHVREINIPTSVFKSGAAGRLVLALVDAAEREALLASSDALDASQSFVDPAQLDLIRARGYAISTSKRGGVGIAAPVVDKQNRMLGVVGLGLPQTRFDGEDEARFVNLVKETAREVAAKLG